MTKKLCFYLFVITTLFTSNTCFLEIISVSCLRLTDKATAGQGMASNDFVREDILCAGIVDKILKISDADLSTYLNVTHNDPSSLSSIRSSFDYLSSSPPKTLEKFVAMGQLLPTGIADMLFTHVIIGMTAQELISTINYAPPELMLKIPTALYDAVTDEQLSSLEDEKLATLPTSVLLRLPKERTNNLSEDVKSNIEQYQTSSSSSNAQHNCFLFLFPAVLIFILQRI